MIEPPPGKVNVIKSNHPSVRLSDGLYLTPLIPKPAQDVSIYASGDNGVTWDFLVRVAWDRSGLGSLAHPALILAPNGKLQLYMINISGDWNCMLMVAPNNNKKPFNDVRVRQALTLALDRWGGSKYLSKIAIVKTVGGIVYLMGIAQNRNELDRVTNHARNLNYVRRVVSYVRLKDDPRRHKS